MDQYATRAKGHLCCGAGRFYFWMLHMRVDKAVSFAYPQVTLNRLYDKGLTMRDHFAGLAMQGMNANPELMEFVTSGQIKDGSAFDRMAKKAYEQADAMLRAREA
jgi:hypothetical protein